MATTTNKPIRAFRLKGVKVSVFANKIGENVFHKVSLQRIYREGNEWKTTTNLGRDDIPVAKLLLEQAWEFVLQLESGVSVGVGRSDGEADSDEATSRTTTRS